MKLSEMRSVRHVASAGYSISRTAELLHLSQPGISRHVLDVEKALGVTLFVRRRNRLVGLTPAGTVLMPLIDRIVTGVDDLHRVARQFAAGESGSLVVATGHTHAKHTLPAVIQRFMVEFPRSEVHLRQGHVDQIAEWLNAGQADVSVSARPAGAFDDLAFHRFGAMHRIVLAPRGHALLSQAPLTLQELARWPLITYERDYMAYADIMGAFQQAHLEPRVALSTGDTDTMKTYALCGLGVAILGDHAYEPALDTGLAEVPGSRTLFPSTPLYVGVRRDRPLSVQALRFIDAQRLLDIELVAPKVHIDRGHFGLNQV